MRLRALVCRRLSKPTFFARPKSVCGHSSFISSMRVIGQVEAARSAKVTSESSELFQRCSAEIGVETFAINRYRSELGKIGASRYLVVLVALITCQIAQFHPLSIALKKVGIVVCILCRDQNYMNVGTVGCFEICQAKNQLSAFILVNRGALRSCARPRGRCRSPVA